MAELLKLRAVTPAGVRAKAAAISATVDAEAYFEDIRDDGYELLVSFMHDAAGAGRVKLGENYGRCTHDG